MTVDRKDSLKKILLVFQLLFRALSFSNLVVSFCFFFQFHYCFVEKGESVE